MRKRFFVGSLITLAASSLQLSEARADTKTCVAAHASGQREAKAGRLKEAAQLYTSCGSDLSCPEQLRSECGEMLESVRRVIPSVIFSVIDKTGTDTSSVKVYAGEQLISDGLEGRAIELDPGKYQLRFELSDGTSLSHAIVVREGEKNRLVQVKAEPEAKPLAAPAPAQPLAPPPPPRAVVDSGPPAAAYVATGVAVLGLATFGTFALLGSKDKSALDDCAPSCPAAERDRRDELKTKFLIADVGLGVGAASAVLAGVLFLTSGGGREEPAAARAARRFDVASDPLGARVLWRGEF